MNLINCFKVYHRLAVPDKYCRVFPVCSGVILPKILNSIKTRKLKWTELTTGNGKLTENGKLTGKQKTTGKIENY